MSSLLSADFAFHFKLFVVKVIFQSTPKSVFEINFEKAEPSIAKGLIVITLVFGANYPLSDQRLEKH